jgi:trehalose 6-phosphate phosphatase
MDYLLNARNLKILESFCLARTLFSFDYDGTLAPIVSDPQKAVMTKSCADLLVRLNELTPVAILTGRKVSDVERLLPVKPQYLIGNHGSEGTQTADDLQAMREQVGRWMKIAEEILPVMQKLGVTVENKEFSLSFHYRQASDPQVAEGAVEFFIQRLPLSRVTRGKSVINVLPANSIDKGKALDQIMWKEKFAFGVYFGDDQTDEDVFRYTNNRLLTVKIGQEQSHARYYLKSQTEMEEVLFHLVNFVTAGVIPR